MKLNKLEIELIKKIKRVIKFNNDMKVKSQNFVTNQYKKDIQAMESLVKKGVIKIGEKKEQDNTQLFEVFLVEENETIK